jgi:HlyD family secretion protein
VSAAEGSLVQARSAQLNAPIVRARIRSLRMQLAVIAAQVQSARSQVADAQAASAQVLAQLGYLRVTSPIDGIVTARAVEPGAVVAGGKTLLTVLDPDTVYLRGFVPEGQIASVRVGEPATIVLDSAPRRPFTGHVSEVDAEASFTPENIYFRDDRVKQVFGVKIAIDRPGGLAKPGMPADATLL